MQNGLWGGGLFTVNAPELIARYNACLRDIGMEETSLASFDIDAAGWSPQIAAEKGKHLYLSPGEAHLIAIILTPEQRFCTIRNPFHSFDRDLIRQFFDNNSRQIAELTQRDGLWLDIDQEVGDYHSVNDLLLVDNIVIRAYTPSRLMVEARRQRDLIRDFMVDHVDFLAEAEALLTIPEQLKESVERVGDIAHRPIVIPDMPFAVPESFYTHAFGGTFVLRSAAGSSEYLLAKAEAYKAKGVTSNTDRTIMKKLESLGLISYEAERWAEESVRLRVVRDSFLMDVLDKVDPTLDFMSLSEVKKKSVLNRQDVKKALPQEYKLLNVFIHQLEKGRLPKKVSPLIQPFLAHPLATLDKSVKEVVWHILSMVCDGRDVVRFYRYDKEAFHSTFEKIWKNPRQTFAVDCINKYHERRSMSQT
jgi:predicted enzyme related to lactoylglutathione lyase